MTVETWLRHAVTQLERASITTSRLDCLILLEDITGKDRGHLLAHPEIELSESRLTKLQKFTERRIRHEPLAYIRGKTEFYGREFAVNSHVLEPRPETEVMIELLRSMVLSKSTLVADIGTGSGALAITTQLEFPSVEVIGVDIDPDCLTIARHNANSLGCEVTFLEGDLLTPFATDIPVVLLCNLPYVPDTYRINKAATHEPRLAIFGGPDGLDLYRKLFAQIAELPSKPLQILTESLPPQHHGLATLARSYGYTQTRKEDFIQLFELQ